MSLNNEGVVSAPNIIETDISDFILSISPENLYVRGMKETIVTNGLVTWHPLNLDNLYDHTSNNNNGTNHGTTFVAGMNGGARHFIRTGDYSGDYISLPTQNFGISGNASVTISAWFKTSSDVAQSVVAFGYGTSKSTFSIFINLTGLGQIICGYQSGIIFSSSTGLFDLDAWTHVAITKTPGAINTNTNIYLNGAHISGSSITTDNPNFNFSYGEIGSWDNGSMYFFDGSIFDIRLYDRVLSLSEINIIKEISSGSTKMKLIPDSGVTVSGSFKEV